MKGMDIIEGALDTLYLFFIFLLTVRRIRMFFKPKTFLIPRGIIPQNFRSLGFVVSEELGNKQTNRQTNALIETLS